MNGMMQRRTTMAVMGVGAGIGLYTLYRLGEDDILTGRPLLVLGVLLAVFSHALLAMVGPLRPLRAAFGGAGVAVLVAGLIWVASLRFGVADGVLIGPFAGLAGGMLALVPLPFLIAAHGPGWRDYPALFTEAWGIVVRMGAAWAFVGVVWGVVFLSDALLQVVGLTVIADLLEMGPVPWLITGGVLGLALAVVQELSDYVSPYLILRLLRLLLPIVVVVTAVFLLALPVRGLSGLFGGLSVALTLLAMAGAGATLVTTAVDCDAAQATTSTPLVWGARALSLMLPVLGGFAAWAVWLRVDQYGWTPDRLFAAEVAALALGYGLLYAGSVLRGAGWMARIRVANITMALALMGLAALTLTPVLNAERISTNSQMTRFDDGRLTVDRLDPWLLQTWGRAGEDGLATLRAQADLPGQDALAARLASSAVMRPGNKDRSALVAGVIADLPLQPAGATAIRDIYLAQLEIYELMALRRACASVMPGGGKGCVMVVADLMPDLPGEEAVLVRRNEDGYLSFESFANVTDGSRWRKVAAVAGVLPQFAEGADLIRRWQAAPPAVTPAPINQLALPGGGIIMLP
jgi:hypothetical protein